MIYTMNLHDEPFTKIKNGTKKVEIRLNDEKRQALKVGDKIVFNNRQTLEKIQVRIQKIDHFKSFKELYENMDTISLGYSQDEKANFNDMAQYYSKEDEEKYGVIGITIEKI